MAAEPGFTGMRALVPRVAVPYACAMKLLPLILAGLSLACASALSAATFEGKVSLGMKSNKEAEQVIDYAMKDGLVRMEPKMADAGGTAMIMNWAKQEMIILMPEQQMYMVMPMKMPAGAAGARADGPEPTVEKTGKTETILGYTCEQYVTTEGGQTTEMWITDQLGTFMGLSAGNPMGGAMGGGGRGAKGASTAGWEKALKGKEGAFPLRVIARDNKGRETFRLEAKKIEPGPLPASLFTPPAGFQKFSMPGMGGFGG